MRVIATIISGILCYSANAQWTQNLDSVVIHENRFDIQAIHENKNLTLLTRQEIAALPVQSLAELLSYVNGVDLRQRGAWGGQADISIDGSTFDQVLIMVNGVKMSDPQTGHHLLNLPVPLNAIERIEILRGAAARIYGVNALAGVINIVTRQPDKSTVGAEVYAGSNFQKNANTGDQYVGWGSSAFASLANEKMNHFFSVGRAAGNGYRPNTEQNIWQLFYNSQLKTGETSELHIMGGYVDNDFGASLFYAAPNDSNAAEHVQTAIASVKFIWRPAPRLKLSPRVSYRFNKDDYVYREDDPDFYRNIHETGVWTTEIQASLETKNGLFGAGVEWRGERIQSAGLGDHQRDNLGLYAEYKHFFSRRLNATVGVYGNDNSIYDWQIYPGLDIGYRLTNRWKVFANMSTGQRLPNYTDLYYVGPGNVGNELLQPESAFYSEAGARYQHQGIQLQMSGFLRRTTDFIDWVRQLPTDPWQPQNFQSITMRGLTFQFIYPLANILPLPDRDPWFFQLSYTGLDAAVDAPEGKISKYAVDALRHQVRGGLRMVWLKHLHTSFQARYNYRFHKPAGYFLLDARVAWEKAKWYAFGSVNNVFNTEYREIASVPLPGRWCTIGAGIKLD